MPLHRGTGPGYSHRGLIDGGSVRDLTGAGVRRLDDLLEHGDLSEHLERVKKAAGARQPLDQVRPQTPVESQEISASLRRARWTHRRGEGRSDERRTACRPTTRRSRGDHRTPRSGARRHPRRECGQSVQKASLAANCIWRGAPADVICPALALRTAPPSLVAMKIEAFGWP